MLLQRKYQEPLNHLLSSTSQWTLKRQSRYCVGQNAALVAFILDHVFSHLTGINLMFLMAISQFAVQYDARANSGIERMKIIDAVAKSVPAPHKVDLKNPEKTIIVQIIKVSISLMFSA